MPWHPSDTDSFVADLYRSIGERRPVQHSSACSGDETMRGESDGRGMGLHRQLDWLGRVLRLRRPMQAVSKLEAEWARSMWRRRVHSGRLAAPAHRAK